MTEIDALVPKNKKAFLGRWGKNYNCRPNYIPLDPDNSIFDLPVDVFCRGAG